MFKNKATRQEELQEAVVGIFNVCSTKNHIPGKSRFMNKCPMNTLRLQLSQDLFPGAFYISLVRNPRAVIRSWLYKIIPKLQEHPRSAVKIDNQGFPQLFDVDGTSYSWLEMIEAMSQSYQYVVDH